MRKLSLTETLDIAVRTGAAQGCWIAYTGKREYFSVVRVRSLAEGLNKYAGQW